MSFRTIVSETDEPWCKDKNNHQRHWRWLPTSRKSDFTCALLHNYKCGKAALRILSHHCHSTHCLLLIFHSTVVSHKNIFASTLATILGGGVVINVLAVYLQHTHTTATQIIVYQAQPSLEWSLMLAADCYWCWCCHHQTIGNCVDGKRWTKYDKKWAHTHKKKRNTGDDGRQCCDTKCKTRLSAA